MRILAVLVGCIIAFLLAEVLLRVIGISYPSFFTTDPCCGAALRPGASGWWTREGGALVEINSDGLRDVEHHTEKDPNRYRIAVMGDSFTFAPHVALQDTYWRVATSMLERCGHLPTAEVEMINFGVSGYGTAQELRMYETRGRKYTPDLVLLAFVTGNDLSDNFALFDTHPFRPYFELRGNELVLNDSFMQGSAYRRRQSTGWKLLVATSNWSRVIQLVNEARNRLTRVTRNVEGSAKGEPIAGSENELGLTNGTFLDPPPPLWEDAWRVTEAILTRFRDSVRADGADFYVITLSRGIQTHPNLEVRAARAVALGVPDLYYAERRIAAHLRTIDVPYRNLAPAMARQAEGSGLCLHGFENAAMCKGHWNEEGHRVAGKLLAESLCAHFAAKEASPAPEHTP